MLLSPKQTHLRFNEICAPEGSGDVGYESSQDKIVKTKRVMTSIRVKTALSTVVVVVLSQKNSG